MGSYKQFEEFNTEVTEKLKENFLEILEGVGEDIHREGIVRTPERAAKVMQYLTSGHCEDPAEILRSAMFAEDYHDMVIVKDIEIYSLCLFIIPQENKKLRRRSDIIILIWSMALF